MKSRLPKETKERLLAATRGKRSPVIKDARFRIAPEALLRLLTTENRRLLTIIAREHPSSVSALAESAGREQGNVSRSIARLVNAGIVRLVPEGHTKRPEIVAERIRFDIDLVNDHIA